MKINFRNLMAVIITFVLGLFTFPALSSHTQGAELTYMAVAPNTYVVTLKYHRDCTGQTPGASMTLNLQSAGCNLGRTQVMTRVSNSMIGDYYCSQLGAPSCTSIVRPNYEEINYTTTLTFSASERQCADWLLSWSECCFPNMANLINAQSFNVYAEAYLKLSSGATIISNNSVQFLHPMGQIVNGSQGTVISSLAIDPDGDSLVYSLQAPGSATGSQLAYTTFAPSQTYLINPQDSTQIAFFRPGAQQLSPTFPFPAYGVNWVQPAPRYVNKDFTFNSQNGSLAFTSPAEIPNATFHSGQNRYSYLVRVDEYRKIGGIPVKVGSVQRNLLLLVSNSGLNVNPAVIAAQANGQAVSPDNIIHLRPGTPLAFTFATTDLNTTDFLSLESNAGNLLPGAVFTKTTGQHPAGTITWTPTAAQVRDQIYYFNVKVEDNACPVKGIHVQTFAVKVSAAGGVTGLAKAKAAITEPTFTAYPNPFAATITFKVKQTQPQQQLLIYNVLGQQIDQIPLKGQIHTEQEVNWTNAVQFPAGQYLVRFSGSAGQSIRINKLQ